MIAYIVKCPDGRRWAVREAVSLKAACNAINHARVLGSIGSRDTQSTWLGEGKGSSPEIVLADVHQLNSDGTFRQPYTQGY